MKIHLSVYHFAGGLRAMASFWLRSKELNIFGIVKAIVDTGSPHTILGIDDVEKMRVSKLRINKLESRKEPLFMGGSQVKAKNLQDANFKFANFEVITPILISIEKVSNAITNPQPSILGVNFLEKNNLKFVFDPNKREAYFEKED